MYSIKVFILKVLLGATMFNGACCCPFKAEQTAPFPEPKGMWDEVEHTREYIDDNCGKKLQPSMKIFSYLP